MHGLARAAVAAIVAMVALTAVVPASPAYAQDQHQVPVPDRASSDDTVERTAPGDERGPILIEEFGQLTDPADAVALHVKLMPESHPDTMDTPQVAAALDAADASVEPLFSQLPADQGDLAQWVRVEIGDSAGAAELFEVLNELDAVEAALPEPVLAPAAFAQAPSATPNYEPNQLYLNPAPQGIDAAYASTIPGGQGNHVAVADIEYSWNTAHEDLPGAVGAELDNGLPADPFDSTDHGTAAIGIVGGADNGTGVTGIAPESSLRLVNVFNSDGAALADAILLATANSEAGDVILIEQQLCPVPLVGGACGPGWLPVEWFPSYYDAIVAAVDQGITVVEPAGNGDRDIDGQLSLPDSGAIIVGAGNPSVDCTFFGGGPARGRLFFSNYGSRVDLQAHGACVWTTGSEGGPVDAGAVDNERYTALFSGTSSAAAIVAGAAASLSSVALAAGDPLAPSVLRSLLRSTGTPQDTTLDPLPIGPLPDLRGAIDSLLGPIEPAPANDDFYTPTTLAGLPTSITQDTAGATVQAGEPVSTCGSTDATVWFNFTPPTDGPVSFSAHAAQGGPSLAIWEVAGTETLGQVGCAAGGSHPAPTLVSAPLEAAKTYSVQVGATGGHPVTLTITGSPTCDLNADGFGDHLIGAPGETINGNASAGAVNVFYGHPTGQRDHAPLISQASSGVAGAAEAEDNFGSSLACGDIDGDGYDDAVVGIAGESRGARLHSGAIQVFYGGPDGIGGARDQMVSQASGAVPGKAEAGDRFGSAVAVGDINGDGYDDVVIGAPGEGIGTMSGAGLATVLYGTSSGLDVAGGQSVHQNVRGVPGGAEPDDALGAALAVGDTNGDGLADIYIGVPGEGLNGSSQVGAVVVVAGSPAGADLVHARWVRGTEHKRFGSALVLADLNADLSPDLAIGSLEAVDVLRGSLAGVGSTAVTITPGASGVAGVVETGDRFGLALAATNSGSARLYIGAAGEDLGGRTNAGAFVEIEFGPDFAIVGSSQISQNSAGVVGASERADRFGHAIAAEDLDGDGFADLVVAAPGEKVGQARGAGMVIVVPGSDGGLDFARDRALHQDSPGVGGVVEQGDGFGTALG